MFTDNQKISKYIIMLFSLFVAIIFVILINAKNFTKTEFYVFSFVNVLIFLLLFFIRLKVTYDFQNIIINFEGFKSVINWKNINSIELKRYNPLLYGYGLRYSFKSKRKIYTIQGNIGLFINGENNYLVGVHSHQELSEFLKKLSNEYPHLNITNSVNV
mgnify:CR=1 FL=1